MSLKQKSPTLHQQSSLLKKRKFSDLMNSINLSSENSKSHAKDSSSTCSESPLKLPEDECPSSTLKGFVIKPN